MKMKYLVPAFLAFSLISGAVLSSEALARNNGDCSNGYSSSRHNGDGYNNDRGRHNGNGYQNDRGRHNGNGYQNDRERHNGGYGKRGTHMGYNLDDKERM